MYDLIAHTAGLILAALLLAAFVWGRLHLPVPLFVKRFWGWRMVFFIVGVVVFLMLVIEWASEHQQAAR